MTTKDSKEKKCFWKAQGPKDNKLLELAHSLEWQLIFHYTRLVCIYHCRRRHRRYHEMTCTLGTSDFSLHKHKARTSFTNYLTFAPSTPPPQIECQIFKCQNFDRKTKISNVGISKDQYLGLSKSWLKILKGQKRFQFSQTRNSLA
jgi:hypothetical protein